MTAPKCEERGVGFFFGERDRQTRLSRFVRASLLFLSLSEFSLEVSNLLTRIIIINLSLSLPLESMSVIARCATFVATKTSLKQQFAVNNRSSATKIVRYAIKERKRCERLYIWSFRAFATKVFLCVLGVWIAQKMAGKRLRTTTALFFLSKDYYLWRRRRRFSSSSSSLRRYDEY